MRKGKVLELMRKGRQALNNTKAKSKANDSDLLKVLQSEITHELSSSRFQDVHSDPPEGFELEWDAPHSQDIVLRKKCETGEEVAVSALLGSDYTEDSTYPRFLTMKVCVKKPGLSSLLQFDCGVFCYGDPAPHPEFFISSVRCLRSSSSTGPRYYAGPLLSESDRHLRLWIAFEEYLKARGIGERLWHFLLLHMHRKEQNQYVNWLQKLKEMVS